MAVMISGGQATPRASGFTLVEIAIVLVIVSVIITFFAAISTGLLAQQRRQATSNKLAAVDAALVQYVMQQKRLPCPADGTGAGGTEGPRTGAGCTGNQANGVVPWTALGLSEPDIVDGWGRRITYRLPATLAADNAMDMSKCDPAGSEPGGLYAGVCNAGCTSSTLNSCTTPATHLSGKGLLVRSVGGAALNSTGTPNTGAAFVLVSHGETGGGGLLSTGTLAASTTTDGTEEAKNYANLALQGYYVDDQISTGGGTAHFDDIVLRPTVLSVVSRAGLGPRSH